MIRMTFSFPSYRNLCRYLGETDALVELTELACRSFQDAAKGSADASAFITAESERFGIRVNLSEVELLSRHLARSYIVTVYQSAERFLHEFRREHRALYRKDWVGDADDLDPLTVTLKNLSVAHPEAVIGLDILTRFQYYRIIRNWVVHTKDSDPSKPLAKFGEIVLYSAERQQLKSPLPATNRPDDLTFDDFICFSRVTKLIAEKLCSLETPSESHWLAEFPMARFKRFMTKPERLQNSIAGYLRTEFGMDAKSARWIAEKLYGSLA
jgi:hypothetical protein